MSDNQKKFLDKFAALLHEYGVKEIKSINMTPRLELEIDGEKLRILKYEDGVFVAETRGEYKPL